MNTPTYNTEYGGIEHDSLTDALVNDSRWLKGMTRDYAGFAIDRDDLLQEATLAWLRAAKHKDPAIDKPGFRRYARPFVRSALLLFTIRNKRIVSPPRSRQFSGLIVALAKIDPFLTGRERDAIVRSIAEQFGLTKHETSRWDAYVHGADNCHEDCDPSLLPAAPDPMELFAWSERMGHLHSCVAMIERLPEREREIVERHWLGDTKESLASISRDLGISPQRTSQLHKRALEQLAELVDGMTPSGEAVIH